MHRLIYTLVLLIAGTLPATAAIIDFEEFNIGDGPASLSDSINSQGYLFTGSASPGPIPDGLLAEILIGNSGSKSLAASSGFNGQDGFGAQAFVSMRRADGGAFAISSLDLVLEGCAGGGVSCGGNESISGNLVGGGSANLAVAVGTGDWLNLEFLQFSAAGDGFGFGTGTVVEIDNINVSAVPVPAAVWLFGSALAGLGWMRRIKA